MEGLGFLLLELNPAISLLQLPRSFAALVMSLTARYPLTASFWHRTDKIHSRRRSTAGWCSHSMFHRRKVRLKLKSLGLSDVVQAVWLPWRNRGLTFRLQTKIEKTNLKLLTTSKLSLTLSSLPNLVARVVFFTSVITSRLPCLNTVKSSFWARIKVSKQQKVC